MVEIGPTQKTELGETNVYLNVDHDQRLYLFDPEEQTGVQAAVKLSKEDIAELAGQGDVRAPSPERSAPSASRSATRLPSAISWR